MLKEWLKAFILALIVIFTIGKTPAHAQSLGQPRNWVDESLNKTIIVEKYRTYTIRNQGVTVIRDREASRNPRFEVKRSYGPGYRNDEAAQSGRYQDFNKPSMTPR